MSRKGAVCSALFWMIRIRPSFSRTYRRPLPSSALVRKTGVSRPSTMVSSRSGVSSGLKRIAVAATPGDAGVAAASAGAGVAAATGDAGVAAATSEATAPVCAGDASRAASAAGGALAAGAGAGAPQPVSNAPVRAVAAKATAARTKLWRLRRLGRVSIGCLSSGGVNSVSGR